MEQEQPIDSNVQMYDNRGFINSSIVQIRLDTSKVIDELKIYLSGKIIMQEQNEDGTTKLVAKKLGKEKCNDQGLQSILSFVATTFNSQVVQGSYDMETWRHNIFFIRKELTKMIIISRKIWNIDYNDVEIIIDSIMNMVEPFLSRLIDNKERESYSNSARVIENNTIEKNKGMWNNIWGK